MQNIIKLELNPSKNRPWNASELEYLYKYDPTRRAYIGRSHGAEEGSVPDANHPFLIILRYRKFSRALGQSTGAGQQAEGKVVPPQRSGVPKAPDLGQLNQDKAH